MLSELSLPSLRDASLGELTCFPRKCGNKRARIILVLIRMRCLCIDEIAKVLRVVGRGAWKGGHVERQKQLEPKIGLPCSLISIKDDQIN